MDSETLAKVEEQRLRLEESLTKLRKSLRHWQTLELDYDALREEFFPLDENATASECLKAASEAGSDVLTDNDLRTLLNDSKGGARSPSQIVELLSKRSEYVERNINSIRKQISDTEKRRNALLLSKDPHLQEDAGLPLSEVVEELDDDGNVISSKIHHPDKDRSHLIEVLQKAGVKGLEGNTDPKEAEKEPNVEKTISNEEQTIATETSSSKASPQTSSILPEHMEEEKPVTSDNVLAPINPDDTEEDARLRQEMLEYGLDEVGHIVAELELIEGMERKLEAADEDNDEVDDEQDEDDIDDYEFDDNDDDDEVEGDEGDEEDSEDETGRARRPLIPTEYRKRMEELQERLGLKNLGPDPNLPLRLRQEIDRPPAAEAARKAALARAEAAQVAEAETNLSSGQKTLNGNKKKVAFSSELDIAPSTELEPTNSAVTATASNTLIEKSEPPEPITQDIIERSVQDKAPNPSTQKPKPISKFKAARSAEPQTPLFPPPMIHTPQPEAPTPPSGQTISDNLIERQSTGTKHTIPPPAPSEDDFDEELQRRQIAAEYHKLRNRKIHEQGGYVGGGEQDNYDDTVAAPTVFDEASGRPRKISRFKVARMQQ